MATRLGRQMLIFRGPSEFTYIIYVFLYNHILVDGHLIPQSSFNYIDIVDVDAIPGCNQP